MVVKIHLIFIFLTSTSFLALLAADKQDIQEDLLLDIILTSYNRNKAILWSRKITGDPYFKNHYLGDQNTLKFFGNIKNYEVFQLYISNYLECHLFFHLHQKQLGRDLEKTQVDQFAKYWVKDHRRKKRNEKYTTLFEEFLKTKGVKSNEIFFVIDDLDLQIMFELMLASSIDLEFLRQSESEFEKKFYDDIFEAIKNDQFKNCLNELTRWRVLTTDKIDELSKAITTFYFDLSTV